MHPFIPVLSPSFLYHPYIPSFKSKDFSFTCILSTTVLSDKYFEREDAKSKNTGPPKFIFKRAKAIGYIERTVRRDVAEKSEISGATFTSPAKHYKIDRNGSYWVILTGKHCDDLCTIYTGRRSFLHWILC